MSFFAAVFSSLFIPGLWAAEEEMDGCRNDATHLRCVKYVKNYDGDTITVDIPSQHPLFGKNISVRMRGIDTPELKTTNSCEKEKGRTARELISRLLTHAKRIDLADVSRDKYFRILADVRVDGKSLSELLLKNNLAVAYDGGTKTKVNWCQTKATASTNLKDLK